MPKAKKVAPLRVTSKDFAEFQHPRALALSPDGKLLAYTLSRCDVAKNKYFANLHVIDTESCETRQWTHGDHADRSPVWSGDGTRLAFVRNVKGVDCVFIIARGGGEAECVFKTLGSFADLRWAENDRSLILKYRKADPDPDAEKALAEGKDPESKTPAVRKVTRLFYRLDGDGFLPEERWQLYRLDLKTKGFRALTKGKSDVECWALSADGAQVAYVSNIHRDGDMNPYDLQISLLTLKSGRTKLMDLPLGLKLALAFSPNGKYLVYLGHHNMQDAWEVEPVHAWLVDLTTGKLRNLTPEFDRAAGDQTIGDLGYGLGTPPLFWSRDSRHIYYQISVEGDTQIARVGLRPADPEPIWDAPGQAAAFTMAGNALALVHLDFETVGELQFSENAAAEHPAFSRLITYNTDYFAAHKLGKVREVHFKSTDKTRVHGWLITPPDFNPRKKYPAILEVHGGPRVQYGRVYFHEMQYLAAEGFVVLYTNPRGSQGYGRQYAGCTIADWGGKDYEDVMAAADFLESQPFVDKKRVGITGGSYGGYMTNLCVGRSQRFRAAVTQRSVTDLGTFVGTSDIGHHDRFEFGGYEWDNPEGYARMSPLNYAHKIRTPLLILHNEGDMRCAIEQAERLYAIIKIRTRTPVEFWRFPEESHGMSRGGRPDRRVIRLEGIRDWFKKWMK